MNIYFSGIGGVGIGPLAEIAHDAGYTVTGSDLEESLIVNELKKRGISVNIGQDGTYLKEQNEKRAIDWFVYTSALPKSHPELVLAKELGIKTAKRDELLAMIIRDKNLKLIAVAGTHGKTTTTGMFIWAMQKLGIPVSYSVGSTIKFGPSGKFDPNSEYFVYECDEFDKNFLNFHPFLSVVTSVDYDHPDTYPTVDVYEESFRQFATQSQQLYTWHDQSAHIFEKLDNVTFVEESQTDDNIKLPGVHNRRNASLVKIALQKIGYFENLIQVLSDFPGTDRRFEKLADNIYSDYGHHPIEIAATMQLAREVSDHVVLVYQPHQNIRQHSIRKDYTDQFELADEIYWLPTYLSREDPNLPILTPSELIENITNKNSIRIADFNDELWNMIVKAKSEGKLILCMGAGRIDSWLRSRLSS